MPPGRSAALFLLLYPALRIPIDLLPDYQAETAATGQMLNAIMAAGGGALLARNGLRRAHARAPAGSPPELAARRAVRLGPAPPPRGAAFPAGLPRVAGGRRGPRPPAR